MGLDRSHSEGRISDSPSGPRRAFVLAATGCSSSTPSKATSISASASSSMQAEVLSGSLQSDFRGRLACALSLRLRVVIDSEAPESRARLEQAADPRAIRNDSG